MAVKTKKFFQTEEKLHFQFCLKFIQLFGKLFQYEDFIL